MTCVVDEYAGVLVHTLVADGTSGGVYACTLNQTEVGEDTNKNKFYIMQIFKDPRERSIFTLAGAGSD